jgi:gas vesicle protein
MSDENKSVPSAVYALGGAAFGAAMGVTVGAALGLLLAPKRGRALRADIKDWTRLRAAEGRELIARIRKEAPDAIEHARRQTREAIAAVKDRSDAAKS